MPIEKIKKNADLLEKVEGFLQTGYRANQEFNDLLSGEAAVTIPSLKEQGLEYQYDASELLYWVDRATYIDELDSWNGDKIKEGHADAIEYLDSSNQHAVFSDLIDLIRRQRIAPFLGAGVSKPAGYPLWREALIRLSNRIASVDSKAITDLLDNDQYLEAAQQIFDESEHQLNNFIQTEFRTGFDSDAARERIPTIFRILPRLSKGCIVTTNFDRLVEEAFKLKGSPLVDGYMHGVQAGHNFVQSLLKGDRCILKLHGDAAQPATYVFTGNQYENSYGEPIDYSNQLPRALRQIYISNSLLFLGCSLAQDKTLALFKEVQDGGQFEIPDHFAIISEPDDPVEKQATENRLLDIKIRPIWYKSDNHHEMATKLVELAADIAERKLSLG
ncbi:SIR2 family protein [Moritella viscosa]|uniref:SIR2 family protein n=1 Tax=Moritella viscosa TaxID=80854 RepID=UPI0009153B7A|nr:SIR2 family protein [Moritella viscosa]SGZ03994.1 Putative uncharacterized protein [Moritella viscosa]